MFKNYQRVKEETEELNMIPIMNLFIVLIPFLLAAAAFYQVGVIPASTPQHTPNQTDVPKTPVTVTINVVIKPDGISVQAASTSLSPEELAALAFDVPRKGDAYDLKSMQEQLHDLKVRYPKSNTAVVLPHDKIRYTELVKVLDHLRERPVGDKMEPLFPVTVFSQFVPPPPPGEEGAEGEEGAVEEAPGEAPVEIAP